MVDERMWGDEDKPEPNQKPGEEQRGKHAPAQVQGVPVLAGAESPGFCVAHMLMLRHLKLYQGGTLGLLGF